ncbi:hypothetical protein GCM10009801_44600 [Streptomyces albiaxialis]|uniref:Uncharacterized protein n=1 Tax=Streptomyces albiaxialis TaxID=329523 RepID=A0ABN2W5U1_9ACTN
MVSAPSKVPATATRLVHTALNPVLPRPKIRPPAPILAATAAAGAAVPGARAG